MCIRDRCTGPLRWANWPASPPVPRPSGGGKSTVAKLAAKFYPLDGGRILLGGTDIAPLNSTMLMKNFSIVFQDVVLFNNTIMENIRVGKKDATDEEVVAVAKAAQCDEFI